VRIEYLTEGHDPVPGVSLCFGSAGFVVPTTDGRLVVDTRLQLSANSTHALMGHGVLDLLNELPLQGRLDTGLQVVIPPAQLESARQVFYQADEQTYGRSYEFSVGEAVDGVSYRIRIDNREYQHTLSGLQFLLRTASHDGVAAWITI
jgi:hypothetical protein